MCELTIVNVVILYENMSIWLNSLQLFNPRASRGVLKLQNQLKPYIMTYDQIVNQTGTVLVEFYASWCPHCRHMMPIVEQVKELLADQVPVYQFDIDQNTAAANEAGVESVPTFIIYRNGRELWRQSGEMEGETLLRTVDSYLDPKPAYE